MDVSSLVAILIIGAIAGWLAGKLTKGSGFGLVGNMVVGILGAIVGGFVFGQLGIAAGGLIGTIVIATLGAVIFLFLLSLIRK
jgi:uncharacterized membrane protein YeaQ/YmgE (transglycosylase-associated protein family)